MLPQYDFDVHPPLSFMYYFTKSYMDQTYQAVLSSGKSLQGKTLYDIGIGRGRSLAVFKALGVEKVIGFDVSEQEASFVEAQAKRLRFNVRVIIDSLQNDRIKEVPDNSCEALALMNILPFVGESRKTLISEVKRILKPGGVLIVVDMLQPSLMGMFSWLSAKPWKFRRESELVQLLQPLSLISSRSSNYFYWINSFMDGVNSFVGNNIGYALNKVFKMLGVPPSTKSFVFTKK